MSRIPKPIGRGKSRIGTSARKDAANLCALRIEIEKQNSRYLFVPVNLMIIWQLVLRAL